MFIIPKQCKLKFNSKQNKHTTFLIQDNVIYYDIIYIYWIILGSFLSNHIAFTRKSWRFPRVWDITHDRKIWSFVPRTCDGLHPMKKLITQQRQSRLRFEHTTFRLHHRGGHLLIKTKSSLFSYMVNAFKNIFNANLNNSIIPWLCQCISSFLIEATK